MTTPSSRLRSETKERKKFTPSCWQIHLKKVIDENKGSGKKLPEVTKMASETYKKKEKVLPKKKVQKESSQ